MEKKILKIAGLGEALWDVHGTDYTFGGAPANVACHCKTLGAESYIVSCVGDDDLGHQAKRFLDGHGVDTSCLHFSSDFETGVVLIELDDAGKPTYEIKEGVAWDNIPFTPAMQALAPTLDAVCFGSLAQRNATSQASMTRFLEATADDCLRIFDINIRLGFYSDEVLSASLKHANALKVNDDELPLLAELAGIRGNQKEQLKGILETFGLRLAILTCGPDGAVMMTPDEDCFASSPDPAPIINTVGAGDSFTATTIMGLLSATPLKAINQHANDVAAYVCTQAGATPPLPSHLLI